MRRARNEPVVAAIPMSLEIPRYGVGVQDRVRVLRGLVEVIPMVCFGSVALALVSTIEWNE